VTSKEIIESGKLELYVAGALCGKERDQIVAAIKADPTLQREVQAIEEAMIMSLSEGKLEPRADVKDKIFAAIKNQETNITRNIEPSVSEDKNGGKVIQMNPANRWLAAASVALLIGLGFTFFALNQKISNQAKELALVKEQYINQVSTNDSSHAALSKFAEQMALINNQNTKKIVLNGVAASPDSKAVVYWNTQNGRVIINPSALPQPPAGKQYQLWALLDGKPISAGVFDITNDSINLQEVKNIGNAQAFAVTLEQKGGVESPTLSAMYVMGTI